MEAPDIDPETKREELAQGAAEDKQRKEEATASVLESVKEGVEYSESETEWVDLGDVSFEVKTDIPSDVRYVFEHSDHPDPEQRTRTGDFVDAMPQLIVRVDDPDAGVINDDDTIREIMRTFDREFDTMPFMEGILQPLLKPALDNMEGRLPDNFQSGHGKSDRNGVKRRS